MSQFKDNFEAHWMVPGGMRQTVASIFWPQISTPAGSVTRVAVPIGTEGNLSVVLNRPEAWENGQRIVLLVHGLTGSEESTHPVRLADAFVRRGFLAIRMNMRGCGPGEGLSRGIYHSGRSEDTRAVLEWIGKNFPGSPVVQVGISLGGNATLKMAGEYGSKVPDFLQGVVAVSAPIDLAACSKRLSEDKNRLVDLYFANNLLSHVQRQSELYPDLVAQLPSSLKSGRKSLAKFDDLYVAPTCGFGDGPNYYKLCSARPLVPDISCPALLLTAEDDPIVPVEAYLTIPSNHLHNVVITKRGGHAAYISSKLDEEFGRFWMDGLIVRWVMNLGSGSKGM